MTLDEATDLYNDKAASEACHRHLRAAVIVETDIFGEDRSETAGSCLAALLAAEVVILNEHWWRDDWPESARKTIAVAVNCSDTFGYACADAQAVSFTELPDVCRHYIKDPIFGPVVWCIKKRGMLPIKPVADRIRASGVWDLDEIIAKIAA